MSSFILHMCVCTSALMHTWGQRELSGVSPFTRWVQRSNSGHQAWQQLPLPSEPSQYQYQFYLKMVVQKFQQQNSLLYKFSLFWLNFTLVIYHL